ncbi:MAG: TIGR03905 family TSCPD domain-containing protein [Lachnospiraceae bacterium]|nr:TIGR03905 family TSCPD domain-containing protein [Lachnospiraceae bacterium]MBP5734166.1 TIGR03905 family TSCPD domain-containing protein [Lachnospiraceae bacterium]
MRYQTHGTCSTAIDVEVKDGIIESVKFTGGCNGNTQGVSALVQGMPVEEAIKRLKGIKCGVRPTSCPDQLARALEQCL